MRGIGKKGRFSTFGGDWKSYLITPKVRKKDEVVFRHMMIKREVAIGRVTYG